MPCHSIETAGTDETAEVMKVDAADFFGTDKCENDHVLQEKSTIKKSPNDLGFLGEAMATQQTGKINTFGAERLENSRVLQAVAGISGGEVKRTTIKRYRF